VRLTSLLSTLNLLGEDAITIGWQTRTAGQLKTVTLTYVHVRFTVNTIARASLRTLRHFSLKMVPVFPGLGVSKVLFAQTPEQEYSMYDFMSFQSIGSLLILNALVTQRSLK
jgi:hypothetical protein